MATTADFMEFVHSQVASVGNTSYKKMFGEYMLYCDGKPVLLICDNTVFVKQIPAAMNVFAAHNITPDIGTPYDGTKPHYILDIENAQLASDMVAELVRALPAPKPKRRKTA